ncbi:hypothetical protein [Dickeya sp. ws52]|uniref:hypothetical protein n=1 Tax=Dickeya sp. ws52 TaxID=2576377 RepID=UPI00117CEB3B|nr:hypothetical protein [Dickeya sp. ws52]TYL44650.1 hypothetical protein FDP13_01020 [Dickeya sp. ws52]
MHSYDGIDYQYSSNETEREKAIRIIANILGFQPLTTDLDYSFNFYSGGSGINDRLAIRCLYVESDWPKIIKTLCLNQISEISEHPLWKEDFLWLIGAEGAELALENHCFQFINNQKLELQDMADKRWEIFFSNESDINSWCVVWHDGTHLNYLSFVQG